MLRDKAALQTKSQNTKPYLTRQTSQQKGRKGITIYAYYLSGTVLGHKFEGSFALTDLEFNLITTELYALFESVVF